MKSTMMTAVYVALMLIFVYSLLFLVS